MANHLKRLVSPLLLCLGLAALGSAQALPINVAVLAGSSGNSSATQVAAQLSNDTYFDFTATVISQPIASLAGYDAVVLGGSGFSNNEYSDSTLAAVRAFMESGGGVVSAGWYRFGVIDQVGQGRTDADAITPIDIANGYDFNVDSTLNITNGAHAITTGVSDIAVSGCCIELASAVDPGAFVLGTSNPGLVQGGTVALAYQESVGRSVYLGLLYLGNEGQYGNQGLRTGDADRLLEQAVAWAADGQPVDLPEPSGTVLLLVVAAALASRRRTR